MLYSNRVSSTYGYALFFDVRVDIRNGNNRRIAYDEPVAHCRPGLQEGAADLIGVPDAGP